MGIHVIHGIISKCVYMDNTCTHVYTCTYIQNLCINQQLSGEVELIMSLLLITWDSM